jgi:uncharacterized protein (DUF1778 family)
MNTNSRLDLRLPSKEKAAIERAAALAGVSASAFVRTAAREAAGRRLEEARSVHLDREASRQFLESLERPFSPNKALLQAMQRADALGL